MPFAFAPWTMKSVGTATNDMVKECLTQFPKIMGLEKVIPDSGRCFRISTEASLREMLAPGALESAPTPPALSLTRSAGSAGTAMTSSISRNLPTPASACPRTR